MNEMLKGIIFFRGNGKLFNLKKRENTFYE